MHVYSAHAQSECVDGKGAEKFFSLELTLREKEKEKERDSPSFLLNRERLFIKTKLLKYIFK